nr:MAG TPA: hypothetical protein [Caudoviricetes sp.]
MYIEVNKSVEKETPLYTIKYPNINISIVV